MDQEQNIAPKDGTFPSETNSEKSNLSMFVGVGAFIIILVGLGWFVFQGGLSQGNAQRETAPTSRKDISQSTTTATTTGDAVTASLTKQGTSDNVTEIDADLKATNLDALGDIDKI